VSPHAVPVPALLGVLAVAGLVAGLTGTAMSSPPGALPRPAPRSAAGAVTGVEVPVRAGEHLAPSTTWVSTPPGYDAAAGAAGRVRYPVVYLLHGTPGTSSDWFSAGGAVATVDRLVAAHRIPPVILVAPDLNAPDDDDTECLDSPRPGGAQVEEHLRDVVAWVDAHYATQADPAGRVVGGMSMGGFCAVDQGLRHQDTYGAIIGLEAFGAPGDSVDDQGFTAAQARAASPVDYLPALAFTHPVPVFLDTAAHGDPVSGRETATMAAELAARGQPVDHHVAAGAEHDWDFAAAGLGRGLVWVAGEVHLAVRT
jgi:enterochelin esterase-like enzyme